MKRSVRRRRKPALPPPELKPLPLFLAGGCLHCGGKLAGKGRRRLCWRCYGTADNHAVRDLYLRSKRGRPLAGTLPPEFGPEIDGDDAPLPGPHAAPCPGELPEDKEARMAELQRRIFAGVEATGYTDRGARRRQVVAEALVGASC